MTKSRLEAFSDGVIAIIITIMVLELSVPHEPDLEALRPIAPIFVSYVLSFMNIAIYWNNHHHLLHAAKHVDGRTLWTNMHPLFWLSLVPFGTAWMGENDFAAVPVAAYGVLFAMAAIAYTGLSFALVAHHGRESVIATALGRDIKGKARWPPTSRQCRSLLSRPLSRSDCTSPSRRCGSSRTGESPGR